MPAKQTKQNRRPSEVLVPHLANRLRCVPHITEIQSHRYGKTPDEISRGPMRDARAKGLES